MVSKKFIQCSNLVTLPPTFGIDYSRKPEFRINKTYFQTSGKEKDKKGKVSTIQQQSYTKRIQFI